MQRCCSKLRPITAAVVRQSTGTVTPLPHSHRRLLHSCSPNLLLHHKTTVAFPVISSKINPLFVAPSTSSSLSSSSNRSTPPLPLSFMMQVRHLTLKQRKKKLKCRKAATPMVSKVKKIKMKPYSSYKDRFRVMKDGQIRRWKEGKRHNAHLTSKKSKRRLRQPALVPVAYAKVMKKLNFTYGA